MYLTQRQWLDGDINSVLKNKYFPKGKKLTSVVLTNNVVRLENAGESASSPLLSANIKW